MPAKCPPDGDGEKVELVWTHMLNEQLKMESEDDPTKSGSMTSRNGARWTCTQQTFWRNQELNGGSL